MPKCGESGSGDGIEKNVDKMMMQNWRDVPLMDTLTDDGSGDGVDQDFRRALTSLQTKDPDLADRLLLLLDQFLASTKRKKKHGEFAETDIQCFRKFITIPPPKKPPPVFPIDPKLIDFLEEHNYLREVGLGLSWEEAMSITSSIHCIVQAAAYVKSARLWGKILGLKKDYYIVECESDGGSPIQAMFEAGQGGEAYEGQLLDGEDVYNDNNTSYYLNILQNFEETETKYRKKFNKPRMIKYPIDDVDVKIQQLKMTKPKIDYIVFPPQPTVFNEPGPEIPKEPYGTGCNTKVYMVSNSPNGPWAELPNVKPEHIVVARLTRLFFTGELSKDLKTTPPFPGTERHYLRAQIARITAGTHVSPMNFYHFPGGDEEEDDGEQTANEIVLNVEYQPLSPDDLIGERGLDYWVHHTPYILEHGTCTMWSETEGSWGEEPPPILRPIICDTDGPGWWPEPVESIGTKRETVMVRSLAWPGAIAWAAGRRSGCFYQGNGLKNPMQMPEPVTPMAEYSLGPDIYEFEDPSVEATQEWIAERQGPDWDMLGEGVEGGEMMGNQDI